MASPLLSITVSIATGRQFRICSSSVIIIVLCKLIQGGSVRGVCGRGGAIGASHSKFKQFAMMLWKGHEAHKWKGWRPEWKGWRRSEKGHEAHKWTVALTERTIMRRKSGLLTIGGHAKNWGMVSWQRQAHCHPAMCFSRLMEVALEMLLPWSKLSLGFHLAKWVPID